MAKAGSGHKQMARARKRTAKANNKAWNDTVKMFKKKKRKKKGCYIATCVYGGYDCPQLWTLRRFRDETLEHSLIGRVFISLYYSISPALVNTIGRSKAIRTVWRLVLDRLVEKLTNNGVLDTPYEDKTMQ